MPKELESWYQEIYEKLTRFLGVLEGWKIATSTPTEKTMYYIFEAVFIHIRTLYDNQRSICRGLFRLEDSIVMALTSLKEGELSRVEKELKDMRMTLTALSQDYLRHKPKLEWIDKAVEDMQKEEAEREKWR